MQFLAKFFSEDEKSSISNLLLKVLRICYAYVFARTPSEIEDNLLPWTRRSSSHQGQFVPAINRDELPGVSTSCTTRRSSRRSPNTSRRRSASSGDRYGIPFDGKRWAQPKLVYGIPGNDGTACRECPLNNNNALFDEFGEEVARVR